MPSVQLPPPMQKAIEKLEEKIILKGYSRNTLKNYKTLFITYISHFKERDLKDRKTVLSPILLELLRSYYKKHKPAYWLIEGQ